MITLMLITTESTGNKIYLINLEIEKAVEDIDAYFKKYTEEIKPQVKTITYETDGAISSYAYFNYYTKNCMMYGACTKEIRRTDHSFTAQMNRKI